MKRIRTFTRPFTLTSPRFGDDHFGRVRGVAQALGHRDGAVVLDVFHGGGQRLCIGSLFADLTNIAALVRIAQRFRLELDPGRPLVPQPLTTLRPRHGVWVRARAR